MTNKTLLTQSYVCAESDDYTLLYYVFCQKMSNGRSLYGLTIRQLNDHGVLFEESALISESEDVVVGLIYRYARNFVFPVSLLELVEDMECA